MKPSRPTFLAIAIALALAFAASTAAPALAGPEEVAYGCGEKDICLIDPDNQAAVRNLTNSGAGTFYYDPVWSPDGTKLAFIGLSSGTRNVYVMAPFVSGAEGLAKPVTEYADGSYVQTLAWSPDGTEIAFQRGVSETNYEVLVANSDGTTAVPLKIAEHGQHPSWAPDGGKIAYSYEEQVYLRNADASAAATMLPNGAGHDPVWSPDGALIAFDGINTAQKAPFSDVHIVSASGGGTPVVVPSNYTQWTFVSWAPGGSKLAYRSTESNSGYARVVDRTGASDHPLAGAGTVGMKGPASWSPDGGRVVFYSYDGTHRIYIENTDGSGSAKTLVVTEDGNSDPAWRPNPAITPTFPGSPSVPGTPSLPITPSGGSNKPLPKTKPARVIWTKHGPSLPAARLCPASQRRLRRQGLRRQQHRLREGEQGRRAVVPSPLPSRAARQGEAEESARRQRQDEGPGGEVQAGEIEIDQGRAGSDRSHGRDQDEDHGENHRARRGDGGQEQNRPGLPRQQQGGLANKWS